MKHRWYLCHSYDTEIKNNPFFIALLNKGGEKDKVETYEDQIVDELDDYVEGKLLFELPTSEILKIIDKSDIEDVEQICSIISKMGESKKEESILLLNVIKADEPTLNECVTILSQFESSPVCRRMSELFSENEKLPERDTEHEIFELKKEIKELQNKEKSLDLKKEIEKIKNETKGIETSSFQHPLFIAANGRVIYKSLVVDSMRASGFRYIKEEPQAVLVWYDNLPKNDFFGPLQPWQIVNRFPMANVICRRAPLVRLIQRTAPTFPSQFKFLPKSFIVPIQQEQFEEEVALKKGKYIIKPDIGSLGVRIQIIEAGESAPKVEKLSVAQEYIPSLLIDGYKFDFRIYVLLASVDPLRIYVYRNGVASFCSKKSSEHSVFSELTSRSINKKNPDVVMTQIVKLVADVMNWLKNEGHDTDRLWQRIDRAIVSTIITASKFLKNGMEEQCPKLGIQRCFQILGFDILLSEELDPYILEVNYRPSLETDAPYERKMKLAMLSDAMKIMQPAPEYQEYIRKNFSPELAEKWPTLVENDEELKTAIMKTNNKPIGNVGGFVLAYPTSNERQMKKWDRMIQFVSKCPAELRSKYFLPPAIKKVPHEEIAKP